MSPEAQRIAIAEACGWKCAGHPEIEERCKGWACGSRPWAINPEGELVGSTVIPDYTNDLNAMHTACSSLTLHQREIMRQHIIDACAEPGTRGRPPTYKSECDLLHATAGQRSEAFLRTLNLWKK